MAPAGNAVTKSTGSTSKPTTNNDESKKAATKSKQKKRVKWKDHFGGNLEAAKIIEKDGDLAEPEEHGDESSVSWSDRRKRDRLREKELLAKAK